MRTHSRRFLASHFGKIAVSIAVGMGGSLLAASPASACFYTNEGHCYAVSVWKSVSIAETLIDAHTIESNVPAGAGCHPGCKETAFVDNEEWSLFLNSEDTSDWPGWIEEGDITTQGNTKPKYFEASNSWYYPKKAHGSELNFNKIILPGEGPGYNWWDATTYSEEGGSWCDTIEGEHLLCFPGLEKWSNQLEDGLEYAANNDPERDGGAYATVQGEVIGYAKNSHHVTTQWEGAKLVYADNEPGDPWPPAGAWGVCGHLNEKGQGQGAIFVVAPAWLNWPECSTDQGEDVIANPAGVAPQQAVGGSAAEVLKEVGAPAPDAPAPLENYKAPTGPTMPLAEIQSRVAASTGQNTVTATETMTDVPLSKALAIAAPGVSAPREESSGMKEWLKSETDVTTETGDFTLSEGTYPDGVGPASGKYLTVVTDAHTGEVDIVHLGSSRPELWKECAK
jgi:hypothetical protein